MERSHWNDLWGFAYAFGIRPLGIYVLPVVACLFLFNSFQPKPRVTSAKARYVRGVVDDDIEVVCTVANDGAAGTVKVFASVVCPTDRWKKQETIRISENGVAEVRFLFPEFHHGQATYAVTTDAGLAQDPRLQLPVGE